MSRAIVTSRSAVATYLACPRKRFLAYEAENGTGTPGWERRAMAIPLVTGIYVHKGLEALLGGANASSAASTAKAAYLEEVGNRRLAVEDGTDESAVIDEQAHHVEALVLAWARVRLPKWQEEYEVVEVEAEDRVPLSEDVTLAVRADAVVRRRFDQRMFVVNFKTVGTADDRWLRSWEVDMQLMTELLAAERRHGGTFGGVIIEGLIKGRRMPEKGADGSVTGYRDSSPLLYGYKCDADPPLVPLQYQWDYSRRKGWYRFPVWKESFPEMGKAVATEWDVTRCDCPARAGHDVDCKMWKYPTKTTAAYTSALDYWVNWLPEEVVEAQFITVPPIMRDAERISSCVKQIISIEMGIDISLQTEQPDLDWDFPQNTHACTYPSRCPMYDACWTPGVGADMGGSGLYQARHDHHALEGTGE